MKIGQPDKELARVIRPLLGIALFASLSLSFSSYLLKEGGEIRGSDLSKQDKEEKRGWEEEEENKGRKVRRGKKEKLKAVTRKKMPK